MHDPLNGIDSMIYSGVARGQPAIRRCSHAGFFVITRFSAPAPLGLLEFVRPDAPGRIAAKHEQATLDDVEAAGMVAALRRRFHFRMPFADSRLCQHTGRPPTQNAEGPRISAKLQRRNCVSGCAKIMVETGRFVAACVGACRFNWFMNDANKFASRLVLAPVTSEVAGSSPVVPAIPSITYKHCPEVVFALFAPVPQ